MSFNLGGFSPQNFKGFINPKIVPQGNNMPLPQGLQFLSLNPAANPLPAPFAQNALGQFNNPHFMQGQSLLGGLLSNFLKQSTPSGNMMLGYPRPPFLPPGQIKKNVSFNGNIMIQAPSLNLFPSPFCQPRPPVICFPRPLPCPPPPPPPSCSPPPPPPSCSPPPPPPPPPTCSPPAKDNYLYIAGDPKVGGENFTPFDINLAPSQQFHLIGDPTNDFGISFQMHEINPEHKEGIQDVTCKVNGQQVFIANDGTLSIDGVPKGNINDPALIGPIDLGNGCSIGTAMAVDNAAGNQAKRFVLTTPEYQFTAALRTPQGAGAYYDINLAEQTPTAANDAFGDSLPNKGGFTAADILRGTLPPQ